MDEKPPALQADPQLIEAWLRARSLARGLPQPVADRGGLRLETNLPKELRRYVFARTGGGLRRLVEAIVEPRVFLKVCVPLEELAPLLPPRWALQGDNHVMTCTGAFRGDLRLPDGYTMQLSTEGPKASVRIATEDGSLAASGHAATYDGVFIYDRIATDAAHRRRGLGRAVMAALQTARRETSAMQVLVATAEGRALYATLGWALHAPYSTAVIPS